MIIQTNRLTAKHSDDQRGANHQSLKIEMHPFVGDIIRWLDADACGDNRRFRSIYPTVRLARALQLLESRKIALVTKTDDSETWMPVPDLLKPFAHAKFSFQDIITKQEEARSNLLASYDHAIDRLWSKNGSEMLRRSTTSFQLYADGLTRIGGRSKTGMLQWETAPLGVAAMAVLQSPVRDGLIQSKDCPFDTETVEYCLELDHTLSRLVEVLMFMIFNERMPLLGLKNGDRKIAQEHLLDFLINSGWTEQVVEESGNKLHLAANAYLVRKFGKLMKENLSNIGPPRKIQNLAVKAITFLSRRHSYKHTR